MNLLEAYSKRLSVAESVYSNSHAGAKMDQHRKIVTAQMLKNLNSYLTEAFDNSVGVQKSDLGAFKKFSLNLTTVAVPSLIAHDLVITYPMTSRSGYLTYVAYTAGSDKGGVKRGDVLNDVWGLKQENNENAEYTSSKVSVSGKVPGQDAGAQTIALRWTPVIPGSIKLTVGGKTYYDIADENGQYNGDLYSFTVQPTLTEVVDRNGNVTVSLEGGEGKTKEDKFKVKYGTTRDGNFNAGELPGSIVYTDTVALTGDYELSYVYDNTYIPQNDIPLLNAKMEAIPLYARARRIAVYYSQIDQFVAKTDYGWDLGESLATQAVGQLQYEIDTEVVKTLDDAAGAAQISWNRAIPVGVSKAEHYQGFSEVISIGSQLIYDRTKRFTANWMIVASDVLPVIAMIQGWKAAPAGQMNGPYFAGELNGIKVFVSPAIAAGRFLIGVLGNDMMSAVAVYAPYMTILPTSLLNYADSSLSQGYCTMYDIKVLNANLVVAGKMEGMANTFMYATQANPFINKVKVDD